MAVEVKIPTILRTYTGGAKTVPGEGDNLAALLEDLESRHTGLKGRLVTEDGSLHRFVNVYVNDEDVRFTGSLDTALSDGDAVTILPAVAGGSPESGRAGGSPEFGPAGGSPESGLAVPAR
jgi:MoaD family protein